MKYKKQISKNYRKIISVLLLLYFITSPFIFASPIESKCSGSCPMSMNSTNTEMQMNMMSCSHCGMMMERMMSQSNEHHNPYNAEFDMSKCDMDTKYASSVNYLITVKYSVNINLQQISFIDLQLFDNNFQSFQFHQIDTKTKDPPIYLIVDSFLI